MEPVSTYEQYFGGTKRVFELYADHIEIHGRRFGSTFDQEIALTTIASQVDRADARPQLFYGGIALVVIAAIGFVMLAFDRALVRVTVAIIGLIGAVGPICIAIRPRRLKAFMFKNRNGEYLFEIIGAGRDANRVTEFSDLVIDFVRKTQIPSN